MRVTTYNLTLQGKERTPCLVRESSKNYPQISRVTTPSEAVRVVNTVFEANRQAEEHCYMIAMRSARIVGVFEVSHGTVNASMITPKELLTRVLLVSASSFLFFHNHPSGDSYPSREDRKITKAIKDASEIMGIDFLDHIIIGENDMDYYSFAESSEIFK